MKSKKIIVNAVIAVAISLGSLAIIQFFGCNLFLLHEIPPYIYLYTSIGFLLLYILGGVSTKLFLHFMGYKIPYLIALENFFFGNFFSYITPLYVGGQPFQVYHLSKFGVKTEDATNFVTTRLFETFVTTLVLDILIIKYAINNLGFLKVGYVLIIIGFVFQFILAFSVFLFMIAPKSMIFLLKPFSKFFPTQKIEDWLGKLKNSARNVWKKKFYVVVIDQFFWLINISIHAIPYYLVFRWFNTGFHMNFFKFLSLLSLVNTVAYYAPTPGATGGIEGMYQLVFSPLVGGDAVGASILLWRIFSYYIPIFIGLIFIWRVKDISLS